jgi:glycerol-1-phosphate dehydrogenase [NAD(P)+]
MKGKITMKTQIIKIKPKAIECVADTLIEYDISGKILYVSGTIVDKLYGVIVKRQLEQIGRVRVELVADNTIDYAMNIAERIIATDVNCIVGLGGGRVLDVCKYAAYIAKIPFLSIPTTAANDGLSSPIAVLKRKDNKAKSLGCAMADMVIIDTDIIYAGPMDLIKAGIGDTISNYNALIDWKLACDRKRDVMNGYAYLMSQNAVDVLMKTNYKNICSGFIEVLVNSLVLSGIAMDFAGSSRPVSGAEHLFSHALDYYGEQRNLHGIQTALGTIAILKMSHKHYGDVKEYLEKFNVDINPQKLNINEQTFVYCMQHAKKMRENRYTVLDELDLNDNFIKIIYREIMREFS